MKMSTSGPRGTEQHGCRSGTYRSSYGPWTTTWSGTTGSWRGGILYRRLNPRAREPSKDIYCMESIHETKFFDNLNLLSMALRGDPRILLVFSILACNTKINNFFAPHSSSKMPETGAAYTCVHICTCIIIIIMCIIIIFK